VRPDAAHPQWIVPDWPAPANVMALVTTRAGGVSAAPFDAGRLGGGMNIGASCGDEPTAVDANRARLAGVLPGPPRWLRQVHGAQAVSISEHDPVPVADAAVTRRTGQVCVVSIADCLPVLFADQRGRAVGVAHAGWRGLAAGILQNAAAALRGQIDDERADLIAWLGPAIGPERFEVGDDVLAAMRIRLPRAEAAFRPIAAGKYLCDLFLLARQALAQAGVDRVHGGGICTYSDPARFYSFRRDRVTGRHAALIWRES
jgi:YfiH family protein